MSWEQKAIFSICLFAKFHAYSLTEVLSINNDDNGVVPNDTKPLIIYHEVQCLDQNNLINNKLIMEQSPG